MKKEIEEKKRRETNLRIQLRNSLSEIRFLAYKYCEFYGYETTPGKVIDVLEKMGKLPNPLLKIYLWHKLMEASHTDELKDNIRRSFEFVHQKFEELKTLKR